MACKNSTSKASIVTDNWCFVDISWTVFFSILLFHKYLRIFTPYRSSSQLQFIIYFQRKRPTFKLKSICSLVVDCRYRVFSFTCNLWNWLRNFPSAFIWKVPDYFFAFVSHHVELRTVHTAQAPNFQIATNCGTGTTDQEVRNMKTIILCARNNFQRHITKFFELTTFSICIWYRRAHLLNFWHIGSKFSWEWASLYQCFVGKVTISQKRRSTMNISDLINGADVGRCSLVWA